MGKNKVKRCNQLRPPKRYTVNKRTYIGCVPGVADGWCRPDDAAEYQRLVMKFHDGQIMEIGAYEGLSLYYIKDICKANNNKLHCVDFIARPRLVENCQAWDVNFVNKASVEAALEFPDEFFDLIYIDADHHKSECTWDIWAWLPKLKKEGILCGHDYHKSGVRKALQYVFGTWECSPFVVGPKSVVWSIEGPHDKVVCWPDHAIHNNI